MRSEKDAQVQMVVGLGIDVQILKVDQKSMRREYAANQHKYQMKWSGMCRAGRGLIPSRCGHTGTASRQDQPAAEKSEASPAAASMAADAGAAGPALNCRPVSRDGTIRLPLMVPLTVCPSAAVSSSCDWEGRKGC